MGFDFNSYFPPLPPMGGPIVWKSCATGPIFVEEDRALASPLEEATVDIHIDGVFVATVPAKYAERAGSICRKYLGEEWTDANLDFIRYELKNMVERSKQEDLFKTRYMGLPVRRVKSDPDLYGPRVDYAKDLDSCAHAMCVNFDIEKEKNDMSFNGMKFDSCANLGYRRKAMKDIFGTDDLIPFIQEFTRRETPEGGTVDIRLRVPPYAEKRLREEEEKLREISKPVPTFSPALWGIPPVKKNSFEKPKRVIFSGGKTIAIWPDDSKTMVSCSEDEWYDEYDGFCAVMVKKLFGSTTAAKKFLKSVRAADKPKKVKKAPVTEDVQEEEVCEACMIHYPDEKEE